jgi:polyhydroxyalkanoate depolymerase
MLYFSYQTASDATEPLRDLAHVAYRALQSDKMWSGSPLGRGLSAFCQMVARTRLTHHRPPFGIDRIACRGTEVAVVEEAIDTTPFATLVRFRKDIAEEQPRVLVIAPLSGHFATLLRGTIRTLLAENDVYVTDWHNARDVSLEHGRFGFDDYVDHIIRFVETMGPGTHLVAVCQPCVQALAAVAIMAQGDHPAQPRSMTLMAGPIDTRISPTKVNELARSKPIEWFEKNLIARVPPQFRGAGRKVYPGFVQLSAFISMNLDKHIKAHGEMFAELARGEYQKAEVRKTFYDEYFAVLDLTAEFYLETVETVFQRHALPLGELTYRNQRVDPRAIRRTALLTVEGERDDICSVGQTLAAHDLCSTLKPSLKRHHMQPGVGHYGVFSGRKWEGQVYPLVRNLVLSRA